MRLIFSTLLVIMLAITLPYTLSNRETKQLDDSARQNSWGDYLHLSQGVTHYELSGPKQAPLVVLVHGGTVPAFSWDKQVSALSQAGYQVLRYDQYGRGMSDRPDVIYDRQLYLNQLNELLKALKLNEPVHLIGISFGGATSTNFAANFPDKVKTLTLLAPVYDYAEGKPLFSLASLPGVGEWYIRVLGVPKTLSRGQKFLDKLPQSWSQQFIEQMQFDGFERSLLSMARSDALGNYKTAYQQTKDKPMLLIWGDQDKEIPKHHIEKIQSLNKQANYIELTGIDHNPNSAAADRVNQAILEFLKSYEQKQLMRK